jgi:transposase
MAVVLEPKRHWCAAYDALVATAGEVELGHPARLKAIAYARNKTAKIDVRILAHLLRADLIPEARAPSATPSGCPKRRSGSSRRLRDF